MASSLRLVSALASWQISALCLRTACWRVDISCRSIGESRTVAGGRDAGPLPPGDDGDAVGDGGDVRRDGKRDGEIECDLKHIV